MNLNKAKSPALILIDIQKGFDDLQYWGNRNNPEAEHNASKLLDLWRREHLPIFHVQHCSTDPKSKLAEGNVGNEFKEIVKPRDEENILKKHVNSAFIDTDLKAQLDKLNVKQVVIVGLTTDHCVSTTTRMAGNFGYDTYIVYDATATFDKKGFEGKVYPAELIHETALASINEEFATVVMTNQIIEGFQGNK